MNWTKEQAAAIQADNQTVLVSAAAGSGKTAVLVERVTRLIREGGDISRMLIVTFTRAAAAEMRERIAAALEKESRDAHVYRQRLRIDAAQISTLHTFCQRVIREHFEALGTDPMASVGEESQLDRLKNRAYEDAFGEIAEHPTYEQNLLYQCYPAEDIMNMTEKLRQFLLSLPDPWDWAEEKLKDYDGPLSGHPAYRVLLQACRRQLETARPLLERCFDILLQPGAPLRYADTVRADEQVLESAISAAEDGSLRGGKLTFSALPRAKKGEADQEDPEVVEQFKAARDSFKAAAQEAVGLLPVYEDEALADSRDVLLIVRGLVQTLRQVEERYQAYKSEKNLFDYSDLEHFCLKALRSEAVRQAVAGSFDTIFVDEYQDVSAIQESIIEAVHEHNTLFLVGDVKQSIYAFRQANPSLFLRKYRDFSFAENASERKILLQNNFRSDQNVLSAVNHVFARVMRRSVTEIDYDDEAMLKPGPDTQPGPAAEIHLLEEIDPETGEAVRLTGSAGAEAEAVARHILRLAGKTEIRDHGELRPLRFRDIVILMRNAAGYAALFAETLQTRGIPVYSDVDSRYFDLPEVSDMIHLMEILDNPLQDFPLLAVLRCPAFGFTDEELARARLVNNQSSLPFHQVFAELAEQESPLGAKARAALDRLAHWRMLSRVMRPEDLIRQLADETGIYMRAGAAEDGASRQANLRLLSEKAEGSASIADFLTHAQRARSTDDSRTAKTLSDQEDVVRIMTMHKSKGLEFPVVFLTGLCRSFRSVSGEAVKMDRDLGISMSLVDPESRIKRTTMTETAIEISLTDRNRAEEARLLYVAMTRAKNLLILYGSPALISRSRETWRLPAGDAAVSGAGCMMDWVMQTVEPALNMENGAPYQTENGAIFRVYRENAAELTDAEGQKAPPAPAIDEGPYSERTEKLLSRTLPESRPFKVSVSAIAKNQPKKQPEMEDEEETPETKRNPARVQMEDRPRFMQDRSMTAAEKGTTVHKALGLIDYGVLQAQEVPSPALIAGELDRMLQNQQLTQAERAVLRPEDLAAFFASPAGGRALSSPLVRREWSFNLMTGEDTMVQGVLDLCFLEGDEWVLVDYKTDYVQEMDTLLARYAAQLNWYRRALERLTGRKVKEALIYSVVLRETIAVPVQTL